jgi:hypothetical protein
MKSRKAGMGIIGGFCLFGIGLGFLLSPYLGIAYGMPAGIFIGIGIGVFVQQIFLQIEKWREDPKDSSSRQK